MLHNIFSFLILNVFFTDSSPLMSFLAFKSFLYYLNDKQWVTHLPPSTLPFTGHWIFDMLYSVSCNSLRFISVTHSVHENKVLYKSTSLLLLLLISLWNNKMTSRLYLSEGKKRGGINIRFDISVSTSGMQSDLR